MIRLPIILAVVTIVFLQTEVHAADFGLFGEIPASPAPTPTPSTDSYTSPPAGGGGGGGGGGGSGGGGGGGGGGGSSSV
ncbi:MAG: hypothetical protein AAB414_04910, partial [Patescibacteria group bacterium]